MRVVGVKRAWASPPRSFSNSDQLLTDVGLWSCGRRTASSKRSGKSTGLLAPYTVGDQRNALSDRDYRTTDGIVPLRSVARAPLSTAALCPQNLTSGRRFPERLAPQSLILEVIGLGRAGPPCMSAYHSHCL